MSRPASQGRLAARACPSSRLLAAALVSAVGLAGCAHASVVERAYDGDVVRGRFVEPEAYAAFLRGAIAEASGQLADAAVAYEQAARLDAASPEIATRLATVRCTANPRDPRADGAFAQALREDASYARAWSARAACAMARGDSSAAHGFAARAAQLDPSADAANALAARTSVRPSDSAVRDALVALTVTARDPVVAWDALAAWAEAGGDLALWVHALEQSVKVAPGRRDAVARTAEQLAGLGALGEARAVAAAAVDADEAPMPAARALASRLALDEAIGGGDAALVSRRATRGRLMLDEAAGRALLAGRRALARGLAQVQAGGDPTARGARLVLAAASGADAVAAARDARPGDGTVSAAALVAFGVALAHDTPPEKVRAALDAIPHDAPVAGDDRVGRPAVELASRGALDATMLTPDGVVELAALRGEPPPDPSALDARHEYLALALAHPEAARTRELAQRLAHLGASDPVVAAASALVQLGTGVPIAGDAPRALLARDPADPLLAATALRLAEKVGDTDVARRARATLSALAGKPRAAAVE